MSSVSDFLDMLFNGQAPENVPSTNQRSIEYPPWYNDYVTDQLSKVATYTNEPYTAYPGPRVAGVDPAFGQAKDMLTGISGSAPGYYGAAASLLTQGANGSALDAANPYLQSAFNMSPSVDFGGSNSLATSGALAPGGLPLALPLVNRATSMSAAGAARPFAETAAAMWPDYVDEYMSPYTSNVVDEMERLSNRNLSESLIPALRDQFVRSGGGGYGLNSREGDLSVRLGRDVAADLLGQQAGALEAGYKTSADIFGSDMSRQMGLAQIMGNLTAADMDALIKGGATLGDLAERGAQRQISGAGVLGQNAAAEGNIQLGAQRNAADIGLGIGNLSAGDYNRMITGGIGLGNLGNNATQSGLDLSKALTDIGSHYEANTQANLDTAYKDFTEQRDWPLMQAARALGLTNGLQLPRVEDEYTYGPANMYGPSPMAEIGSLLMSIAGIKDIFGGEGGSGSGGGSGGNGYTDWLDLILKNGDIDWGDIFGGGNGNG